MRKGCSTPMTWPARCATRCRTLIGSFNAAMTAVQVVALIEDRAKVEIEVTAVVPDAG